MAAFLDVGAFAAMFRPLSAAERNVAAPLLVVAERWIRDHKPDVTDGDPAAMVVLFEIVRDALVYGKYAGLASFTETTGNRTKSGTFGPSDVEQFVTDRHRQMLGIGSSRVGPRGRFKRCDY